MPQLRRRQVVALRRASEGPESPNNVQAAPVPDVPKDLSVCPGGNHACRCLTFAVRNRDYREAADQFFIGVARERGYLCDPGTGPTPTAPAPGFGRGLAAFYRDNDMTPPGYVDPATTGWSWDEDQ